MMHLAWRPGSGRAEGTACGISSVSLHRIPVATSVRAGVDCPLCLALVAYAPLTQLPIEVLKRLIDAKDGTVRLDAEMMRGLKRDAAAAEIMAGGVARV